MITHFKFMYKNMKDGVDGYIHHKKDLLVLGEEEFSLSHARRVLMIHYNIHEPESGWKQSFTDFEKKRLRPIAETLAMLDGNAFFGNHFGDKEWYESYLPEAHALYESNGGNDGWAGLAKLDDSE